MPVDADTRQLWVVGICVPCRVAMQPWPTRKPWKRVWQVRVCDLGQCEQHTLCETGRTPHWPHKGVGGVRSVGSAAGGGGAGSAVSIDPQPPLGVVPSRDSC